jgi:dihydrofolate reductase
MRKIILQMMVTLNGYYEGPNQEIDWHNVDEEFNEYALDLLNTVDTLLFGRVTYQLMADYWPSASAGRDDPIVAGKMNEAIKIVFSKTLPAVEWNNSRLVKDDIAQEISTLKQQPGKDMAVFGSSDLAVTLITLGLIDEYRIIVNPVILGDGKPLFKGLPGQVKLKFIKAQTFRSGNVALYYQPIKN